MAAYGGDDIEEGVLVAVGADEVPEREHEKPRVLDDPCVVGRQYMNVCVRVCVWVSVYGVCMVSGHVFEIAWTKRVHGRSPAEDGPHTKCLQPSADTLRARIYM